MYECPNCGGNLKFDIASQQLKCDYCLTMKDPYEVTKDKDAEESNAFDVTVFTCPQCGGEILSTDTSVAEFCSFCGASTILDSRISKEKRPAYIIPFQQTKDACKEIYLAKMKRAIFAPNELKDKKYIDSFRSIYIPYWAYTISHKGHIHMTGKKSYQRGNYHYTDHYGLSGDIDACYSDLSYDASSSFSDAISEQIAPFDVKQTKQFTPSFLSGFYADTADVASDIYKDDAIKIANDSSYSKLKNLPDFKDLTISSGSSNSDLNTLLHTHCDVPERTLYPVWFMSYRKGNRVAYATVNGQTGKVAADIPVDSKKYILGSLLLALPIFLLLNLFFTFKPTFTLGVSVVLAILTFVIHMSEVSKINQRDQRADDRGYLFQQSEKPGSSQKRKTSSAARGGSFGSLVAVIIAALIFIINPVADFWYYGGTIIAFIGILFTIIAIIRKYNILATRKLPQFDRTGGDDRA
ncbi:MAG: hypothetical protein HDQ97_14535 [Lachnospiraceae bacterium]|nr:hypothetical protein [Lachnospiraceae bacterium]